MRLSPIAPALSSTPEVDGVFTRARFVASISELDRRAWEACFPGEIEGYDYHVSIENAGIQGFQFGWYVVEEKGRILCAAPVFQTSYDLATTAQGATRALLTKIQQWVPGHLTLRLSCLGSLETEALQVGFDPALHRAQRQAAFDCLLTYWSEHTQEQRIGLTGVKDLSATDRGNFHAILVQHGFDAVASLPTAYLEIDFDSTDAYLARLSTATRKDMRRKLRRRAEVCVEFSRDFMSIEQEFMAMYAETRARSDWAFEDLTAEYFQEVIRRLPDQAIFALYYHDDKLCGANLLLVDSWHLLDKFFVMRGSVGRELNLYFLSWLTNVELCLERGLTRYQSGQAGYETKVRLGSRLERNWIYFRHRNPFLHRLLQLISPLLAVRQPDAGETAENSGPK